MRKVLIDGKVWWKITALRIFLQMEYKLSQKAVYSRVDRIRVFLSKLANPADYALCRYRPWREMGYRCAAFEGWVFAYEVFPDGVIVRDMAHGKALDEA